MSTPQQKASLASRRHKREIAQAVKMLGHDPEALADTIAVVSILTAGRILGALQAADIIDS